ncbi:CPBP family intramembrane glutamic endopeptidase [Pontibacillus sp. HMF3514]|uniref:CPBP family intramembrane glutamic endopeptidase n=1 Tax=Pontibacillus sp. HMF3514 TaxID=2692425 RepID=UPI00131F8F14|nr:type II CAAX endopeptidase family protein [Pontibacillus sp. HMF3514]QHE50861.1 CPBP family intramembrane metalloprotease [Pontibacillus sp. HMF3514]
MPNRYWYVIITYIVIQLSGIIGYPILHSITGMTDQGQIAAYWSLISFPLGLVLILFILKPDMKKTSLREGSSTGNLILWSFLGILLAYAGQIVAGLIELALGIQPESQNTQNLMEIAKATPAFIIIIALIAPILEEIIFRKIIFGSLYKVTNFWIAVFSSSLIFAFVHWDFEHILKYSAMGFVFAFLYVKTKRIIVPIIAHMMMNLIVVLIQLNVDIEKMEKQLEELQTILIGG